MAYAADFTNPIDIIRHKIGDTDPDQPFLVDAEIMYEYGKAGDDTDQAAVQCAYAIAARMASLADTQDGDLAVKASQLSAQFTAIAERLADTNVAIGAVPYVGGMSRSELAAHRQDTDRVQSWFARRHSHLSDRERW